MKRAAAADCVGLALFGPGCGDDDGAGGEPEPIPETTSTTLDFGGLDLEVPEGFFPIPAPSLGFGLAVPDDWQATLLTPDALAALGDANLDDPAFTDAAADAAAVGAVLYAAGVDPEIRVTDLKLDVQVLEPGVDIDDAMFSLAKDITLNPDLLNTEMSGDPDADPVSIRIRFQTSGPGGADAPVSAEGTQYLFRGDGEIWSLIITSEDAATHDAVADQIAATFVLSDT